ncbi:MAG: hypothetical protein ACLF0G_04520 [Candidatus Brocadiia bacterium]
MTTSYPVRWSRVAVAALAGFAAGCAYQPRRMLRIAATRNVLEGRPARVRVTVKNVLSQPIVPVSLGLHLRRAPGEYFALPRTLAEADYLRPIRATQVRHLPSLNRIEALHIRDAGVWRRVPNSRFLHPARILLPGQSYVETFDCQARRYYRGRLYCDLYYLRLATPQVAGSLYRRAGPETVPPDADRYTEVFTPVEPEQVSPVASPPDRYLLVRPRGPSAQPARLVRKRVPLDVRPRPFSYHDAAAKARYGARDYAYFSAAGMWVFDYGPEGTWFVGPVATVKLQGSYVDLIKALETTDAASLTLTAPRRPDDKLAALFRKAGYTDPQAAGDTLLATIPVEHLLPTLEQAEALGYAIDGTTWRPLDAAGT